MLRFSIRLLAFAGLFAGFGATAGATDYPVTVTDLAGRSVEIKAEPQRIVVQDGRDLFALTLLDREDPLKRVVAWNNIVSRSDPQTWNLFKSTWPESAAKALDMKFGDEGQINIEQAVAAKPDLIIYQVRVRKALDDADLLKRFDSLGVPVIMIDTEMEPTVNAPKTVSLLGKVLNREKEAREYTDFYATRLAEIRKAIEGAPKPKVFVEAKAGQKGADFCCFTHGDVYWGKLISEAGGINLGSSLVKGRTGDVTIESVISAAPDVYVMTGSPFSSDGSVSPPFGFGAHKQKVSAALGALERRKGFDLVKAVRDHKVYGVYHQLYASAMNLYAVELLAKAFYPDHLKGLDPDADLHKIVAEFTGLPKGVPVVFGAKAPEASN
ncbi:ABC transporter substrate-binding protein [Rhizobium rhizosphaerae]|uniref:ABC transporter substrate-binding protein n=1 Tax=Xaviernesmea rhizosphaerae TaxID=1672749 RepID=UPI0009C0A492|nr:ABC transporter substrate-binding protein [Xaviernesmea rhizosphaerae]